MATLYMLPHLEGRIWRYDDNGIRHVELAAAARCFWRSMNLGQEKLKLIGPDNRPLTTRNGGYSMTENLWCEAGATTAATAATSAPATDITYVTEFSSGL